MSPATAVVQGTPEWLALRETGIGSSDAPVIAGERGSVVELWAEKSGLVSRPEPDDDTARAFEWGHRLEPVVAEWYSDTTGRPLRRVNRMLVHPEVPWAFASLDRVTAKDRRIVEIKTERWGWRGDEAVPGFVQAQVQHQMWVSGYEIADVAVLTGGSLPHIYEITRDETFIDNLIFLESEFWGWVTSGVRPPVDGSENARRVLSKLHPRNDGTLIPANPDSERVFIDWLAAKVVKDQATDAVDTLANTLRALIGDADGIDGLVTWKRSRDAARTDWPTVANEVGLSDPALLAATIAAHTTTTEGPRVLRSVWKGPSE